MILKKEKEGAATYDDRDWSQPTKDGVLFEVEGFDRNQATVKVFLRDEVLDLVQHYEKEDGEKLSITDDPFASRIHAMCRVLMVTRARIYQILKHGFPMKVRNSGLEDLIGPIPDAAICITPADMKNPARKRLNRGGEMKRLLKSTKPAA